LETIKKHFPWYVHHISITPSHFCFVTEFKTVYIQTLYLTILLLQYVFSVDFILQNSKLLAWFINLKWAKFAQEQFI